MSRVVSWFSCGAASAVATKKALEKYGKENFVVASCVVENEHPDNQRFLKDCEQWFGQEVEKIRSEKYKDIYDVFEKTKYLVGVAGARCTAELKKIPRQKFQKISDVQIFGFTAEEKHRAVRFKENNPEVDLVTPLIDLGLSKKDCFIEIQKAGISLPIPYLQGFKNSNCLPCVKGGAGYYNLVRKIYPERFEQMAQMERKLKRTILKHKGKRIYLDELPKDAGRDQNEPDMECGLWCKGDEK